MIPNAQLLTIAKQFGTPLYVYEQAAIENQVRRLQKMLERRSHLLCYAVKANSNLSLLRLFDSLGCGFDIVSEGELRRVLQVSADPRKVVFAGVGKSADEIQFALQQNIKFFNLESAEELEAIEAQARIAGKIAPVSFRINPNIKAGAHEYLSTGLKTSKFGIPIEAVKLLLDKVISSAHLEMVAVDCHIGSGIFDVELFRTAYAEVLRFAKECERRGAQIKSINFGGGLGVSYSGHYEELDLDKFSQMFRLLTESEPYEFIFEPGKFLIAEAGTLLTRVLYRKENEEKKFAVVDAGMNDLIRPALYQAYHKIELVSRHATEQEEVDIVGPVCESGCYLALKRMLPVLQQADLLAVRDCGAYGMAMASRYNSRRLPAEVLVVSETQARLIRRRETYEQLWQNELTE